MDNYKAFESAEPLAHQGRRCQGFTLVELLISIGIFVSLLALVGYAQSNLSRASSKGLALAELHHQSAVVMDRLRMDFSNMQPHAGARIEIDAADPAKQRFTFLYTIPRGTYSNDVNGRGWVHSGRAHLLTWVQWQFHPALGLRRGDSRPHKGRRAAEADVGSKNNNEQRWDKMMPSSEWGRLVVPQRQMKHFFNRGDPEDETNADPVAEVKAFFWLDKWGGDSYGDPFMVYRRPNYQLGNNGNVAMIAGRSTAHGARMPPPNDGWNSHVDGDGDGVPDDLNDDGIPDGGPDPDAGYFAKDRLNLLGVEHSITDPVTDADLVTLESIENNPYYPCQLSQVAHNVEFFKATWVLMDGTEVGPGVTDIDGTRYEAGQYLPDERDRAANGPLLPIWAGMPVGAFSGAPDFDAKRDDAIERIGLRRDEFLRSRARHVRFRFVMHDMFEDPLASGYQDPDANPLSINYLRAEFYSLPPADQTHELFKRMIERGDATAIIVDQVVKLP